MRHLWRIAAAVLLISGCAGTNQTALAPPKPAHPSVVIKGVDVTLMAGELLNGCITVDCGQGELTLLTEHIHDIIVSADADKIDSDSVKVSGKIKETRFVLKSEHGVFTLQKENLKKIEFI